MLKKIFWYIADMLTGKDMERAEQHYVESRNPKSAEDRQRLVAEFWQDKTRDIY